jgi:hypothetical protein
MRVKKRKIERKREKEREREYRGERENILRKRERE